MPSKLTVAKIVPTSTPFAWSQAYHAGGFTAVIALSQKEDTTEPLSEEKFHAMGKELLDTLIAEYFTLTTKDLDTVKEAVETAISKAPKDLTLSLVVGASVKNILYAVVVGDGKVLLKRGEKVGSLVEVPTTDDPRAIESVSGYLEVGDTVILQTPQFEEVFPKSELVKLLEEEKAEELAETLAPKLHESAKGAAAALIFTYGEEESSLFESQAPAEEEKKEEEPKSHDTFLPESEAEKHFQPKSSIFSHSQKLFLTIAAVLAIALIVSVVLFVSKQQMQKNQDQFNSIYNPAKAKYDEGQSLVDLNATLAQEDFQSAKTMIIDGEKQFTTTSPEYQKLKQLLSKVTDGLEKTAHTNQVTTTKVDKTASPLLGFMQSSNQKYVAQDTTNFYATDNTGITQTTKTTSKAKTIVTNKSDWSNVGGFGTYLGNMYVLDTKDGIVKFAASSFSKSAYFSASTPDLTKAVSMTIDGSVWILFSDGSISKYTKGKPDTFSVTGLPKSMANPTSIVTTVDGDNLYVLDNGNSQLVVIKKTGAYVAAYSASIIKNATGLDVDEKNKKAYILSGSDIYQIDLK